MDPTLKDKANDEYQEGLNWRMNHLPAQKRFKILQLPAKQQQAIISLSSQTIYKSIKTRCQRTTKEPTANIDRFKNQQPFQTKIQSDEISHQCKLVR